MLVVASLVVVQLVQLVQLAQLAQLAQPVAAGAASSSGSWRGRPAECADAGGRRPNVWERAKAPELQRYCNLLASASAKLAGAASMAAAALDAARQADKALPGKGASRVLEGRALAALGRQPEALAALREGQSRDPRALDDPLALLALARVLARTEHIAEASTAYRALLPRSAALSSSDRTQVAIEAGLVAMQLGPEGVEQATADFREALREAQQGDAERFIVLALALALDRSTKSDEARTLLAERSRGDPRNVVAAWAPRAAVRLPASEAAALAALALEGSDAAGARDAWEEHLRGAPDGPWAPHARARLAALASARPGAPGAR